MCFTRWLVLLYNYTFYLPRIVHGNMSLSASLHVYNVGGFVQYLWLRMGVVGVVVIVAN